MALVHLIRETPEKGYTNTTMDCQEEFVDKMEQRGWKRAAAKISISKPEPKAEHKEEVKTESPKEEITYSFKKAKKDKE